MEPRYRLEAGLDNMTYNSMVSMLCSGLPQHCDSRMFRTGDSRVNWKLSPGRDSSTRPYVLHEIARSDSPIAFQILREVGFVMNEFESDVSGSHDSKSEGTRVVFMFTEVAS